MHDSILVGTYDINPASLNAQGVLIHLNDLLVLQNLLELWFDIIQVVGHNERGGQYGPDGHLDLALLVAEAEVTDDDL